MRSICRHPEDDARCRRRLHRPRTRFGLRDARQRGDGRRDDVRYPAWRRSATSSTCWPNASTARLKSVLLNTKVTEGRAREGHSRDLEGDGAGEQGVRPRARVGWPPSERQDHAWPRQDARRRQRSRLLLKSTISCAPQNPHLRDWRRRGEPMLAQGVARRPRRCGLPATRSRSSRRRFRQWSSDPRTVLGGLTESQAEGRHQGSRWQVPVGRIWPRRHARSHGRTHRLVLDPDTHRILGVASLVRCRRDDRRRCAGGEMSANATDLKLTIHPASDADGNDDGVCRGVLRSGDASSAPKRG